MNAALPQVVEPTDVETNEAGQSIVELDVVTLAHIGGGCGFAHFG